MSFSRLFSRLVKAAFPSEGKKTTARVSSQRDGTHNLDETVSENKIKLSKPISQSAAQSYSDRIVKLMTETVGKRRMGIIDTIISPLTGRTVREDISTTNVDIHVPTDEAEEDEGLVSETNLFGKILLKDGRAVSPSNLRAMLEQATRKNTTEDMQTPGAPLKYRTGRFANSIRIDKLKLQDSDSNNPKLTAEYSYMERPYSVFDPKVSTYRGLSLRPYRGARSPTRIIPNALDEAKRELISSRYAFFIKKR